jgi:hypothetical protein
VRSTILTSLRGLLFGSAAFALAAACAVSDETPVNTEDDIPDELNTDANQDGLDGTVTAAIFVSPGGNDVAAGTREAPVRTLSTAIQKAKAAQKTQIIMASGVYPEPKTVELVDGIGIYGGYEPKENWKRGSNVTEIDGAEIAMVLRSANKTTRLGRVTVKASDPVASPGASSIVLVAVDATNLVVEDKCVLAAGKGQPGVAGKDGANGTGGGNGEQGKGGAVDNQSSPGAGGNPGVNKDCADANGGLGGKGGSDPNFQGASGGSSALGVKGGGGGNGKGKSTGGDGTGGDVATSDGESGADGVPGKGVGTFDVAKLAYVPSVGGDGTAGASGAGGGGGGGSGGQNCTLCVDGSGNGGGGGGAGGCGGTAGKGGGGGGASIAIVAVRSPVTVTNCELSTFGGGAGGAGGTGGDGGTPGTGGPAQSSGAGEIGTGAKGGDGRKGGRGGAGAGGGGGPSVGIWAEGAGPKVTKVTYKLGPAGSGGASSGATGAGQKGAEKEIGP